MATNDRFRKEFGRLIAKQKANAEQVVRKSALQIASGIIQMSPVDTGRFRGNWNVEMGRIDVSTGGDFDKTGDAATAKAQAKLGEWKVGETIYITNSLPYAQRLEEGYSQQAPIGMVKVTVAQFQSLVRAELRKLK